MRGETIRSTGCCEPLDPVPWDEQEVTWTGKSFLKDRVTCFLHMPLNFGIKMAKNTKLIEAAGATAHTGLRLSDENSLWGADLYIDVTKDVPGGEMVSLSGTYLTKVFEGPYSKAGTWAEEMTEYVKRKNMILKKLYFWYTTCPKCAKAYGKNYVVLFAQVA